LDKRQGSSQTRNAFVRHKSVSDFAPTKKVSYEQRRRGGRRGGGGAIVLSSEPGAAIWSWQTLFFVLNSYAAAYSIYSFRLRSADVDRVNPRGRDYWNLPSLYEANLISRRTAAFPALRRIIMYVASTRSASVRGPRAR